MYIKLNLNPFGKEKGDCVIRAITLALNYNWFMVHDELSFLSRKMGDMPSSNEVWKTYLTRKGYKEEYIENTCPDCLTVERFARSHPKGRYILNTCEYTKANNIIVSEIMVTVTMAEWIAICLTQSTVTVMMGILCITNHLVIQHILILSRLCVQLEPNRKEKKSVS